VTALCHHMVTVYNGLESPNARFPINPFKRRPIVATVSAQDANYADSPEEIDDSEIEHLYGSGKITERQYCRLVSKNAKKLLCGRKNLLSVMEAANRAYAIAGPLSQESRGRLIGELLTGGSGKCLKTSKKIQRMLRKYCDSKCSYAYAVAELQSRFDEASGCR